MLARQLLVAVMALGTLPNSSTGQGQEPSSRFWLLTSAPLSDDVSAFSVTNRPEGAGSPAFIEVTLIGQHGNTDPKRLPLQTIQAWLLRADGTVVAMMPKSFHDRPTTGDIYPDVVFFDFVQIPAKDLVGVVVSVNGKLFVREIKAS
jgi:hypothetical protein